jgi:NAD(P)H-dependent FMN reductase/ketosteroid isomerase-like protein
MADPIRILLISGSLRDMSGNTAVLRTAIELGDERAQLTMYEGMASLPQFNPDDDPDGGPVPAAVADLRAALDEADGVLMCTPEYAGALPGSFKNLLDWTIGGASTYGKPVAWINASSRPDAGVNAHHSLRLVLDYATSDIVEAACRRIVVPRDAVDSDGLIGDPEIRGQIGGAVGALVDYCVDRGPGEFAPATRPTFQQAIRTADEAFFAALVAADVNALDMLLHQEFAIVDVAAGAVHTRGDFLEAVAGWAVTFQSIESHPEEAIVRSYGGDMGIVVGHTSMSFAGADCTVMVESRYTHVYRFDGWRWQLVAAQGTPIAGP